jgi:hypothetical protein
MPRVKRGTVRRAKRKKLLGLAKGYYANKSKLYRAAKESVDTALKYAFVGRRRRSGTSGGSGSCESTRRRANMASPTGSSSTG